MFVRKKKYLNLVQDFYEMSKEKNKIIEQLKEDLKHAEDLKNILNQLAQKTDGLNFVSGSGCLNINYQDVEVNLSDAIPRYVDDLFGGKVIKQESNKAIIINKDGSVVSGVTKEKCDKGYSYKLVRK